jgi:rhodanese-related sulfurtransferase
MTNQIIPFIHHHWLMVILLVIVLVAIVVFEMLEQVNGPKNIGHKIAIHLINREKAVVIDVRDTAAFAQGHIINAINIPAKELEKNITKLNKYKSKPLIFVCDNGQKATQITKKIDNKQFPQVKILAGGIKSWKSEGLPIDK